MNEGILPTIVEGGQISDLFTHAMGRGLLSCIIVFTVALVQSFRFGVSYYWPHIIGGGVGGVTLFAYGILVMAVSMKKEKTWWAILTIPLGGFPWLVGCYFFFYKGLWSLSYLANGFSAGLIFKALIWVIFGYSLVYSAWAVSEIGSKCVDGDLILK